MADHKPVAETPLEKLQFLLLLSLVLALFFWCILVAVLVMYSGALFDIFHFIAELSRR